MSRSPGYLRAYKGVEHLKRNLEQIVLLLALLCSAAAAQDRWAAVEPLLLEDMPRSWTKLRLADEIEVNGLPLLIYEITAEENLQKAVEATAARWTKKGWQVQARKIGEGLELTGVQGAWMKHARFTQTETGIKAHFSLSDLPGQVANPPKEPPREFGKHLPKPTGTLVLNEVRTLDASGESVMTTMANEYDIEQNAAFYEEAMVSRGWKLAYKRTGEEGEKIFKYAFRDVKEATFVITRKELQTFVVVNWITR